MSKATKTGEFIFEKQKKEPKLSSLYEEHLKLTDKSKLADFAGYLMPLWYSSISDEHNAVRNNAGLFDCTHMGTLQISGPASKNFINTISTNDINKIKPGSAQYSYLLDAAGNVLDDIIIYQLQTDNFLVVVNAANEDKIIKYLNELLKDNIVIDAEEPDKKLTAKPEIKNLKDPSNQQTRVDIALQGPASLEIISTLLQKEEDIEKIKELKPFKLTTVSIDSIDCIISTTGYTGAKTAFELFPSVNDAPRLWNKILEAGKPSGLKPCGLGARDSLRIEAGLPLYGHELDGDNKISPIEAGYGWAVKLDKPFFIGKQKMEDINECYEMKVARIELPGEKGTRPVRGNDPVTDSAGKSIGWILSAAKIRDKQIALAFIEKDFAKEGTPIGLHYLARSKSQIKKGKIQKAELQQSLKKELEGTIIKRIQKF